MMQQSTDLQLLSDEEAIARVAAGEPALFELLMRRYNQRLFRIARAIVRSDDEAEDVVQQAYLSAYAHLAQFAGEARFSTWLTRIVINEALARLKRRARHAEIELDEETPMEMLPATPEDQASRRQLTGLLEAAIDKLPEIYRVVVVLRDVQQLSIAETAACLEVTEETIKIRGHRAKAMLRASLTDRMDAVAGDAFGFLGARCDRMVDGVMKKLARAL